jgi:Sulfotransferase family
MAGESAGEIQHINRYRVTWLSQRQKFFLRRFLVQNLFALASAIAYALHPVVPRAWLRIERPIFIVGCSRSGTTALVDLFANHPDIANYSEAAQLFELAYCDPEIDHEKTEADATRFEQARLRVLIGLLLRIRRKRRFLNKHPENSLRLRLLKRIFPDALFIHLIRDGRAVVASACAQTLRDPLRQAFPMGWFPKPPRWRQYRDLPWAEQFAHQWVDIVGYVRDCAGDVIPEGDYIEIRYEDFCADPAATLRRLDRFCRLDDARRPGAPAASITAWRPPSSPAIAAPEMARIAPVIAPLLAELGYQSGAWMDDSGPPQQHRLEKYA